MASRRRFLQVSASALVTGVAGCNAPLQSRDDTATPSTETPTEQQAAEPPTAERPADDRGAESVYARVYRDAIDSVTLVKTRDGQGTGFVFDDGHVVTNAHVVGRSTAVDVRFSEGQWQEAEVVGTDAHSDLAAVAVDETPASATPLSLLEGEATVGQEVVAIGNPYSLDGSLTTGVISGTDRAVPAPTGYRIPDAVQTDAAVNPGNSGGPLMSLDGRVVAVINSGGGDNIAFGISAALTRRVVPELIDTGDFDHAYVGASFADVTPTVAEANGLAEPRGLLVTDVVEGGPAAGVLRPSDGIRVVDGTRIRVGGDVLMSIDGTDLATAEDLMSHLALQTSPGQTVELTVLREGSRPTVELELGARPERSAGTARR